MKVARWEHINLTGIYDWMRKPQPKGTLWPLCTAKEKFIATVNAVRHGVLSQFAVLPWDDGNEYDALIEAFVAEHGPQGPTEEHLVEELAGIIWRKRRVRMAENALHHRALKGACTLHRKTPKAALIHVAEPGETESMADAIRTPSAHDRAVVWNSIRWRGQQKRWREPPRRGGNGL